MSYDPLQLCTEADGQYLVDPAVMFPATLQRIREVVAGEPPTEIMTPGWPGRPDREPVADKFLRQAEAFPIEAWSLEGLKPPMPDVLARIQAKRTLDQPLDEGELAAERLAAQRAAVLDFAESWFKRALVLAAGRGIRLHISRNAEYKR